MSLSHGSYLCDSCADSLRPIEAPFCDRCGETFDGAITDTFTCPNCHDICFAFDFALAALHSEGEARALIHDFKYRSQIHLATDIGKLTQLALANPRFAPYLEAGILIPVPLFWWRKRKRRFNQAEEIARSLAKHTPHHNLTVINALKRTRNTQTQTRFSRKKRLHNLAGAFQIKPRYKNTILNKPVILIDDVFTTGSTANECAKVLISNGAQRVAVLTTLRG